MAGSATEVISLGLILAVLVFERRVIGANKGTMAMMRARTAIAHMFGPGNGTSVVDDCRIE
jgi:hypothetical protein